MASSPEILVEFLHQADLDEQLAKSLSAGGAFARGTFSVAATEECTAVLVHPTTGERLALDATVVWLADDGVGLAFTDFDDAMRERITNFASAEEELLELLPEPPPEQKAPARAPVRKVRGGATDVQKRVRNLAPAEQHKLAKTGDQMERIALERIYGKGVWEPLLRNPKITPPEVARIARKGALPRPLIELICESPAWVKSPQVRRALLSNPRLGRDLAERVLRLAPKAELKLMPKQMSYPASVREIAARLLG